MVEILIYNECVGDTRRINDKSISRRGQIETYRGSYSSPM